MGSDEWVLRVSFLFFFSPFSFLLIIPVQVLVGSGLIHKNASEFF